MPTNEKKQQYDIQYKRDHIKRVPLDLQLEEYEQVKAYTESTGETVNGFIKRAIREAMIKSKGEVDE